MLSRILLLLATVIIGNIANCQNLPNLAETTPPGTINTFTVPPEVVTGTGLNYTKVTTPLVPVTNESDLDNPLPAQARQLISYTDGFGRQYQSITTNASKTGNQYLNVVTTSDTRFLNEAVSFLPYGSASSAFDANSFQNQKSYYQNKYPGEGYSSFSKIKNISTSANFQTESFSPGKTMVGQDRAITAKLTTNTAGQVRIWELDNGFPVTNRTYQPARLSGQEVVHPTQQGSANAAAPRTLQFLDKDGKLVLKMATDSTYSYTEGGVAKIGKSWLMTYYVYDTKGLPAYIFPPKAVKAIEENNWIVTQDVLDGLCFQFRYDQMGRAAYRKQPGEQGFTAVVYDRKGRTVMRQTPNEKALGQYELVYYDKLDRIIGTALYVSANDRETWQASFDDLSNTSFSANDIRHYMGFDQEGKMPGMHAIPGQTILSFNFYDNYDDADAGLATYNAYINDLQFTETVSGAVLEAPVLTQRTHGLPTGSMTRIIRGDGAVASQAGEWSVDHNYYDDKGRLINRITTDADNSDNLIHYYTTGTKYDFLGRGLLSKKRFQNARSSSSVYTELIKEEYEAGTGLLKRTLHSINSGPWATLAKYEYDELGSLKSKTIGDDAEVQDFTYDIRGRLAGINAPFALTGNTQNVSKTFGEALRYDYGFSVPRYDGKLSGIIWRSSDKANAYGYDYDKSGRLKKADFRINLTGNTWSNIERDLSVSKINYDKNGNLLSMKQMGMKPGSGPVVIDQLTYSYKQNSNQLSKVTDPSNNYNLGDFVSNSTASKDYDYDPNGNLSIDDNKGIQNISYNYFNKPDKITFKDGSTIAYSYYANGTKVQEVIQKVGQAPVTNDFIGEFVYENNKFQFAYHSEGRTIYDETTGKYKEEYFVKDHLNNIRSVIDVLHRPLIKYLATYEIASAHLEGMLFDKVGEIRDDNPASIDPGDLKSGRLNGSDPDLRIGTSLLMHVMAGDQVSMTVNNYYDNYDHKLETPVTAEAMLSSIIGTLTGGVGGLGGSESHNPDLVQQLFSPENFISQFQQIEYANTVESQPKAYLNYILFDENMQIVNTVSGAFQANGNGDWAEIGTANAIKMPVNGYLAIYISNRTQVTGCYNCGNVFFDQLQVSVQKSNLLEEKHYYPFGLPVAAMSSPAANNTKPNRNAYQGNENLTHLNLNLMDFHARQYDAQLGRFWAVDPLSSGFGQDMISAYAGMGNAPEASIDPDGMLSRDKPMMTEMPDGNDAMLRLSMAKLNKFDGAGSGNGFVNFANNWSPKNYGIETLHLMEAQAAENGGTIRFDDMKVLGVVLPELEFIGRGKPNLLGWEASVNAMFGLGSPLGSGFNYHARGVTMLFDPHYRAAELGYMPPMGNLHTTLDVAGVIPVIGEVFDGINGVYYWIEGDRTNAAWSFAAMVPVAGTLATTAKWGGRIVRGVQKHHVIPQAIYRTYKTELRAIGWIQNNAANLKTLPSPFHGWHPAYNNRVKKEMMNLINNGNFNLNSMQNLQSTLRKEINNILANPNVERMNDFYKNLGY